MDLSAVRSADMWKLSAAPMWTPPTPPVAASSIDRFHAAKIVADAIDAARPLSGERIGDLPYSSRRASLDQVRKRLPGKTVMDPSFRDSD